MKCRVCGFDDQEGRKLCGKCGATLPQPPPTRPAQFDEMKQEQSRAHSRGFILISAIAVLIAVLVVIGVVDYLPSSKIKLTAYNQAWIDIRITVSIDGDMKTTLDLGEKQEAVVGVWTVDTGSHFVEVNYAYPDIPPVDLGDPPEWAQDVHVSLFNTKNIYLALA